MEKDNKTNTRSKLTLKLKLPQGSSDPRSLALKSAEKKRISNSKVQVTIKGRKKDSDSTNNGFLSKDEFEERKKVLQNASEKSNYNKSDNFDILSKIKQSEVKKPKIEETQEITEDKKVEEKSQIIEVEKTPIESKPGNSYNVDNFDVRNKIKQSIAKSVADQKLIDDEREKKLQAERKLEKEKEKETKLKIEKDKKRYSKKLKVSKFDDDEKNTKNKKPSLERKEKFNQRRLLQTFIVGDDDGEYRKKSRKSKQKNTTDKEYQKVVHDVILPELITVSDLAERMAEKTGDVVKKLFTMGMVATSNQTIDADTAELIITEFGHNVKRVKESDVENIITIEDEGFEELSRAPIVTIMGHVDHGKTSLLDAIRTTDVVGGESGGITQHIGASRVKTKNGNYITFLDTPGHEAFTEMRSRGANATDIVILVVAADDGVKEQTIEAINHAKAAEVPIIVAVNKIDKVGADSSRVKNELLQYEIVAEDLSGDTIFVEVSAKQKTNLDQLEDAILLQSEMLELKAPYKGKSSGTVVETRIDPAKGVVTTLLVQRGTLDIGDIIVVGTAFGKVRKMQDDRGKNIKQATPSMPVEILGLSSAPEAGDQFVEVTEEKQARDIIAYREKKKRDDKSMKNSARSTEDIFKQAGKEGTKYLSIIVKGDVHGSVEAIVGSIAKVGNEEVAVKIIHSATGGITEGDIKLAEVSNAIIFGFNVRANSLARDLAREKNIDIRYHSIIYKVIDELKLLLGGMLDPIKNEEYLGQAEIRKVFKVSGSGKIAGCNVIDGLIKKGAKVRLLRDNVVIHDGSLKTLKRFKDDVKEVKSGFECGIALNSFDDIKEKDIIECYEIVEEKRTL